jgi:hypothetical protein
MGKCVHSLIHSPHTACGDGGRWSRGTGPWNAVISDQNPHKGASPPRGCCAHCHRPGPRPNSVVCARVHDDLPGGCVRGHVCTSAHSPPFTAVMCAWGFFLLLCCRPQQALTHLCLHRPASCMGCKPSVPAGQAAKDEMNEEFQKRAGGCGDVGASARRGWGRGSVPVGNLIKRAPHCCSFGNP